jgi:hypothetical protein
VFDCEQFLKAVPDDQGAAARMFLDLGLRFVPLSFDAEKTLDLAE